MVSDELKKKLAAVPEEEPDEIDLQMLAEIEATESDRDFVPANEVDR